MGSNETRCSSAFLGVTPPITAPETSGQWLVISGQYLFWARAAQVLRSRPRLTSKLSNTRPC